MRSRGGAISVQAMGEWQVTNVVAGGDLGADIRRDMVRIVKANGQPDGHFRRGDVLMRPERVNEFAHLGVYIQ
jgi:hypothetical protein